MKSGTRFAIITAALLLLGAKAPRAPYHIPNAEVVVRELRARASDAREAAAELERIRDYYRGQADAYEDAAALLEERGVATVEPRPPQPARSPRPGMR